MAGLILVQTTIADYRVAFFKALAVETHLDVKIYCGREYFSPSVRLSGSARQLPFVVLINNVFFARRRLSFQMIPFGELWRADNVVLEFNPRILSNWVVLVGRRLLSRPTVLWGHAWSRSGPSSWSENIRRLMRKLASRLIVYTDAQKIEYLERYHDEIKGDVHVAPNSLYSKEDMWRRHVPLEYIIYVGRLVPEKKPHVLIEAFCEFGRRNCDDTIKLCIVGEGPELSRCRASANGDPRVAFRGHVSDLKVLRDLYSKSYVAASPGYAGLSIVQALSFGCPIVVSRKEPHAPEVHALKEGFNGDYFETDDIDALVDRLEEYCIRNVIASDRRESIIDDCRASYSLEQMVGGFLAAVTQPDVCK